MILASNGIIASQILQKDADYLAFYNRVVTAGGSLTTTEQSATEQLVKDLYWIEKKNKFNKLWDNNVKMAFEVSGSYSFEELVLKNAPAAEQLVVLFK